MKVALVGCTHGELDAVYAEVDRLNSAAATPREHIRLIICCGDFESLRNTNDLKCKASPPKYHHMNAFHEYYRGEKRASVLTVFIGGNHEASNYLMELRYGGWVAPNIFFLGAAGVINVAGIRIAGMSGIYYAKHFFKGHFEKPPFSPATLKSVYCVREFEEFQLSHLASSTLIPTRSSSSTGLDGGVRRLDVFLSHDWPAHIEDHGNRDALLEARPDFRESIDTNRFGNPGGERLLKRLRPVRWIAGHMHIRFEALVEHAGSGRAGDGDGDQGDERTHPQHTHFLGLSKCLPGVACLEVADIPATDGRDDGDDDIRVLMDAEWLAILRATHHLASRSRGRVALPTERLELDLDWIEARLDEVFGSAEFANKMRGEWLSEFVRTAAPLGEESGEKHEFDIGNPQTDALLAFLDLPHVLTTPFRG